MQGCSIVTRINHSAFIERLNFENYPKYAKLPIRTIIHPWTSPSNRIWYVKKCWWFDKVFFQHYIIHSLDEFCSKIRHSLDTSFRTQEICVLEFNQHTAAETMKSGTVVLLTLVILFLTGKKRTIICNVRLIESMREEVLCCYVYEIIDNCI